jgi:hypothetical protein
MLKQVHIPRWSQLMRSASMPYLQKPHTTPISTLAYPGITPWNRASACQPSGVLGAFEVGASAEPRANPAFSDAYVIGASGAANMVVPQGIDYSRRPCCSGGGLSGVSELLGQVPTWAWLGAAAVVAFFGAKAVMGRVGGKRPFDRNPWRGAERWRLNDKADTYLFNLRPGETIDAEALDASTPPEHDEYGEMHLGHYDASVLLSKAERRGLLKRVGYGSPAKSKYVRQ